MKKSEQLEKILDFISGMMILWKGWDHLDHFRHAPIRIVFLFLAGASILVGTAFLERIERKVKNFSGFFHLFESISLVICGSIFMQGKRSRMPVLYFFLALVTLTVGLTKLLARGSDREAKMQRLRLVLGIAYVAFAAAMAVVMLRVPFYRHPFMAATLVIIMAVGIFNLAGAKRHSALHK